MHTDENQALKIFFYRDEQDIQDVETQKHLDHKLLSCSSCISLWNRSCLKDFVWFCLCDFFANFLLNLSVCIRFYLRSIVFLSLLSVWTALIHVKNRPVVPDVFYPHYSALLIVSVENSSVAKSAFCQDDDTGSWSVIGDRSRFKGLRVPRLV